jgi:hypothetical protein
MLGHYITIVGTQPQEIYGGSLKTQIEFDASVDLTENVLLDISGIVAIIYMGSFSEPMPSFLTSVTQLQAVRILSIYDTMGVPRPTLIIS